MCEFALPYFPNSVPIYSMLIKMYTKLGLASLVTEYSERLMELLPGGDDANRERLGAYRFSVYTDFGLANDLENLIREYKDFFKDSINDNKNQIVHKFLGREFDKITPIMEKNERLEASGLQHGVSLARTIL